MRRCSTPSYSTWSTSGPRRRSQEHFAHVPEELRLKKVELNRAETRVRNFIDFIAAGRGTAGLADALGPAEQQVKTLFADVQSMEPRRTTPSLRHREPGSRIGKLNHLLATRSETSARGRAALLSGLL
jgi:hypothetical protein